MGVRLIQLNTSISILAMILLAGCIRKNENYDALQCKQSITIDFSDTINAISIQNIYDSSVKFQLKINDFFPLDINDIVTNIKKKSDNDKTLYAEAAWEFVTENTFTVLPAYSSENWQHEPQLFLNSIGGGLCDDRASVLAAVWSLLGDSMRIIGLEGHVVPEIYQNNKWQMYDPSFAIFYCDSNGLKLSVAEIENNSEKIFLSDCNNPTINPIFQRKNPLTDYILDLYTSKENNKDVTSWHLDYEKHTNDFTLPSNSILQILFDKENNFINISVKLNANSKGELQIPLVPFLVKGMFEFSFQNEIHSLSDTVFYLSEKHFANKVNVINVFDDCEIHYLVNPKLKFISYMNSIEIKANKPLKTKAIYSFEKPDILFGKRELLFEQKSRKDNDFSRIIDSYNSEIIDNAFLKKQFSSFLNHDSILLNCK